MSKTYHMALNPVTLISVVVCSVPLSSCCLFYPAIPSIEFRVERDDKNLELHVLEMSRGTYQEREDGTIVARIPSGDTDITFSVRSADHQGQFVARARGSTGLLGALRGVETTYGFRGGLWICWDDGDGCLIRGIFASRSSFVVGRYVLDDEKDQIAKIDKIAPNTEIQWNPRYPGVLVKGRGGASFLAYAFASPGKQGLIYAPIGSSVVIEQAQSTQDLRVSSDLPLDVMMQPGRATIRWMPPWSDESHVDFMIDAITNEKEAFLMSFSSMQ